MQNFSIVKRYLEIFEGIIIDIPHILSKFLPNTIQKKKLQNFTKTTINTRSIFFAKCANLSPSELPEYHYYYFHSKLISKIYSQPLYNEPLFLESKQKRQRDFSKFHHFRGHVYRFVIIHRSTVFSLDRYIYTHTRSNGYRASRGLCYQFSGCRCAHNIPRSKLVYRRRT